MKKKVSIYGKRTSLNIYRKRKSCTLDRNQKKQEKEKCCQRNAFVSLFLGQGDNVAKIQLFSSDMCAIEDLTTPEGFNNDGIHHKTSESEIRKC